MERLQIDLDLVRSGSDDFPDSVIERDPSCVKLLFQASPILLELAANGFAFRLCAAYLLLNSVDSSFLTIVRSNREAALS